MSNDLKDILSHSNKDIDNQQLMDYLSHRLSEASSHEVETNMVEDDFMNDAVEGLQQISSKTDMQAHVEQLNNELQKQLLRSKKRQDKRKFKDQPYTYITIIVLLVLVVISFVILRKYAKEKAPHRGVAELITTGTGPSRVK